MVDAHVLDGHFQTALCQLVGLIDDFCAHAATPSFFSASNRHLLKLS
jgi:hypothetical protein